MADAASLANLRDIALPPAIPWWPPSFGWWVLGAGFLAIGLLLLAEAARHYRLNAYRRAAQRALRAMATAPPVHIAPEVASILKRASLVAYPREQVAGLSGEAWRQFLARSGGFPPDASAVLERAAVDVSRPLAPTEAGAVLDAADHWVRAHKGALT